MKKIRLTENKLKSIIRESIMQILTETYHALDKLVFNFADEVFEEIFSKKEEILYMLNQGRSDNVYFTKYLDFSSVYPKIKPVKFTIHIFRNDEEHKTTRGGLSEDKQHLFISANIFKEENTDEYRSAIIHELNHFVYTSFPHFNYISTSHPKEDNLTIISLIEYMFNKSELTARNSQLSYYLHILNGRNINENVIETITNITIMKEALDLIFHDTYNNNNDENRLSIVLGLNAIRNKTKKGNPSTLTLNDYYNYQSKISESTYTWLKSNIYNRMNKIYKQFYREVNEKISRYKKEFGLQ